MPGRLVGITLTVLVAVAALSVPTDGAQRGDKIKTFVTILPQAYLVERIGGDHVQVGVLVGPGRGPHDYEPTPRQLADLAEARILFTIGVPFEQMLVKKIGATFKDLAVIPTQNRIKLRTMTEEETPVSEHEHPQDSLGPRKANGRQHEHHAHRAGDPDPHIWLDPVLAKTIATNIYQGLVLVDSSHAEVYARNLSGLLEDLDRVNEKIARELAPFKGKEFFVFHPAFGYFAERYGLKQVPVEIEGKQPTGKQLVGLIDRARKAGATTIFVQPQFSRKSAEAVANATGAVVVPMDPLARDYLNNLQLMGDVLAKGFQNQK